METARQKRKSAYQQLWYPALLWPTKAVEAAEKFEKSDGSNSHDRTYLEYIRVLFLAYNQLRKSTDSTTCNLDESIRRILFMSFPEKKAESLEENLKSLKDAIRANLPSDTESADGTTPGDDEIARQRSDRLKKFCKTVTNYAFLLKADNDYKTKLNTALAELRKPLNDTNQPDPNDSAAKPVGTDVFVNLCASARRDGGYLLPYYAAMSVLNEGSASDAATSQNTSEKAIGALQKILDSTPLASGYAKKKKKKDQASQETSSSDEQPAKPSVKLRAAFIDAFASIGTLCFEGEDGDVRMPMDSIYGQLKLRSLAEMVTNSFYPECDSQEILFLACLYLSDPSKNENKNTYDLGCFFWDLCGPYAANLILNDSQKETVKADEATETDSPTKAAALQPQTAPAEDTASMDAKSSMTVEPVDENTPKIWSDIRKKFETSLPDKLKSVAESQTEIKNEREEEER